MSKIKREGRMDNKQPELIKKDQDSPKSPLTNLAWALFFIGIIGGLFLVFQYSQEKEKNKVRDEFAEYAEEIGLDKKKFKEEYDKEKYKDKAKAHTKEAQEELKLSSTPSIFLNGEQISGSYDELKTKVQEQIDLGDDIEYKKYEGSDKVYTVRSDDNVKGNLDAKIIIMEYSQFSCPACATEHPNLMKLLEDFPEQIKIVFRHFNFQDKSEEAARAAEAAGALGKFWEMADILFEKQSDWSNH